MAKGLGVINLLCNRLRRLYEGACVRRFFGIFVRIWWLHFRYFTHVADTNRGLGVVGWGWERCLGAGSYEAKSMAVGNRRCELRPKLMARSRLHFDIIYGLTSFYRKVLPHSIDNPSDNRLTSTRSKDKDSDLFYPQKSKKEKTQPV